MTTPAPCTPEARPDGSASPTTTADSLVPPADGPAPSSASRLPVGSLLALGVTAFVTLLSETLPAGLLLEMSTDLGISTSAAGQSVTVFAIGCIVGAIPLTTLTARLPRRAVVVWMLVGFVVVNTATALSPTVAFLLVTRFLAGLGAGMTWALIPSYARRLAPPHLAGRAISLTAMGGTLALAVGVPAGTALGQLVGWRLTFGVLSVVAAVLVVWVRLGTADVPGTSREAAGSLRDAVRVPGVLAIIVAAASIIVAHNMLYTYVAPFLEDSGLGANLGTPLLVFGIASVVGALLVGVLADSHLRPLALSGVTALVAAMLLLGTVTAVPVLYVALAVWGAVFGSLAPLLQTASARAAGPAADQAQSVLVTVWNLSIAVGSALGGVGVALAGPTVLPLASAPIAVVAVVMVVRSRAAFPAGRAHA